MLIRGAGREYRTWSFDSRRWRHYRPRSDDIVIATYPKCGTTWMQRIVSMLIFQTTEPMPVMQLSPWLDRRFGPDVETVVAQMEAQQHRRFLKAHMPFDGLPFHDEVKYIHVARDGRDACMSLHNHMSNFSEGMLKTLDETGLSDETIARPFPAVAKDPTAFFHNWITRGDVPGQDDGSPSLSFFQFERSWWNARAEPNVLFVHYNDLKTDLAGEMTRLADFLGIEVPDALWPQLVEGAGFDAMKRSEGTLTSAVSTVFREGTEFIFRGTNDRWRGVVADEDVRRYVAKSEAVFSPPCRAWVEAGRRVAGDPRAS
jgi:aryl sulfotransferase